MVVNNKLYALKEGNPVSVCKYSDFTSTEQLVKTALSSLPRNEHLAGFSLCLMKGNIVLTGGTDRDCRGVKSAQTYLMDVQTEKWQQKSYPELNTARCYHTALGLEEQCYVACGWGADGTLNSLEMHRLGTEAWVLIYIPDMKPRAHPILSQLDAKNICLLGGYAGRSY